jgi:hypothetical protein
MVEATDKLTIELPWREALAEYRRRLVLMFYIAAGNVLLFGILVVIGLTVGLGALAALFGLMASAFGTALTATLAFVAGIVVKVVGGSAAWLLRHWLLSLGILVTIALAVAVLGDSRRR